MPVKEKILAFSAERVERNRGLVFELVEPEKRRHGKKDGN